MGEPALEIIEILWEGPYSLKEVKGFKNESDYGLYQIYGTHPVNGATNLLYIGQANFQTLGGRISQHEGWLDWESSDVKIYVGRIGGTKEINLKTWEDQINKAERLLIYYCSPPYNSSNINDFGAIQNTLVFNFGKKNLLPYEVSSLYMESSFWEPNSWKEYKFINKIGT